MNHRAISILISLFAIAAVIGGGVYWSWPERPGIAPSLAESAELSPNSVRLWIGLKNSDDQGTQFDLRVELRKNTTLVAAGETLCVTGVTRNPDRAKETTTPLNTLIEQPLSPGDLLALKVFTRIGTSTDGKKCSGHGSAVGLRLYYDAVTRRSGFASGVNTDPTKTYFLHSDATAFFGDTGLPMTKTPKQKDSPGLAFQSGNPWREIGAWLEVPPDPGDAGKATLAGIDSDGDGVRDDIQRYITLTYPDSARTRSALYQQVLAAQAFLLGSNDKTISINNTTQTQRAIECLFYVRSKDASSVEAQLRAQLLNTRERTLAYLTAARQISGQVITVAPPSQFKSSCSFDPDVLED